MLCRSATPLSRLTWRVFMAQGSEWRVQYRLQADVTSAGALAVSPGHLSHARAQAGAWKSIKPCMQKRGMLLFGLFSSLGLMSNLSI
jgi:hypothetical protein